MTASDSRTAGRSGRNLWFAGVSCLAAIGLVAALVFVDWATLLIAFVVTVGVIAPIHLSIAAVTEDLSFGLLRMVFRWSVRAAAVVLVICGFAASIGFATLPLLGVVAVSAWFVFAGPTSKPPAGESGMLPEPASLSDEELCGAWRRSFAVLEACRTPDDRQAVVELRSRYLDEFERRRPEAFAEWLNAGPTATKDAAVYFVREEPDEGRRSQ
jgi:hypothetical protein